MSEVKKAMEHLLRLVESAPLVDLQHRVTELQMTNERPLEAALMDRLRHVTLKGRTLTDMGAFAEAIDAWRRSRVIFGWFWLVSGRSSWIFVAFSKRFQVFSRRLACSLSF